MTRDPLPPGPAIGPIEKAVPMPRSRNGDGTLKPTMGLLAVGDSFITAFSRNACYGMAKRLRIKINVRKETGARIRVWRVE